MRIYLYNVKIYKITLFLYMLRFYFRTETIIMIIMWVTFAVLKII